MSYLLKITDGACKGAEIALVSGVRIKLGSSDDCDIVLPDATVPAIACELDVTDTSVTAIAPDGKVTLLKPFVIHEFDSIGFAIGPDNAPWEQLKRPEPEPVEEKPAEASKPEAPEEEKKEEEESEEDDEEPKEEESNEEEPSKEAPAEEKKSGGKWFLWLLLMLVILIIVAAVIFWFMTPNYLKEYKAQICNKLDIKTEAMEQQAQIQEKKISLEEIAQQYNLQLTEEGGHKYLKGNCKRHTEALALRALAMAADKTAKLDVTDDESLLNSAKALIFTIFEDKVTVEGISERSLKISGKLEDGESLKKLMKAFESDLPAIESIDTSAIVFDKQENEEPESSDVIPAPKPVVVQAKPVENAAGNAAEQKAAEEKNKPKTAKRDYPVAGILSVPYPCVVLKNGVRCVQGASIGNAVIEEIKADRLVLRENGKTFEWIP